MIKKILLLFISSIVISEILLYISSLESSGQRCFDLLKILAIFINPAACTYFEVQLFDLESSFVWLLLAHLLAWWSLIVMCYEYKNKFKIIKYAYYGGAIVYVSLFFVAFILNAWDCIH
ncbi:MAG: hypothetical protein BA863_17260 [Desulfovibrio sp. S3730MH75]|nr:MAG: hypothetical protein BA863_17260 [Desulfovibrio sp. S3730MH75]